MNIYLFDSYCIAYCIVRYYQTAVEYRTDPADFFALPHAMAKVDDDDNDDSGSEIGNER
jgi:hypothetical protein